MGDVMDLIKLEITSDFVRAHTKLTWRDVLFGMENELLAPRAAVDLAVDRLATDPEPPPALVELAGLTAGDPSMDLVERLAIAEKGVALELIHRKWLYLVLAWLFVHQEEYTDPLQTVEEVYADFGYPETIVPFVRYMPMTGPDLGSKEANESRLYEKWRAYLQEASEEYASDLDTAQR